LVLNGKSFVKSVKQREMNISAQMPLGLQTNDTRDSLLQRDQD